MTALRVRLLGRPELRLEGDPLPVRGKALALLYRLALRPASRPEASALLWGDDGSQSLRQALVALRKLPEADSWLLDGEPLDLRASVDAREFETACREGDAERAVQLYAGSLLEGFQLTGGADFHDWLEVERARLEQLLGTVLRVRAEELTESQPREALALLDRVLTLDPLDERAVQDALRLELDLDSPEAARARLTAFWRRLQTELGAQPLPQTLRLLEQPGAAKSDPPDLSTLALRLSRAQALDTGISADASFWAEVLEVEAWSVAEASAELEGRPPSHSIVPEGVRTLLHRRIALALEPRVDDLAPDAWQAASSVARHWLAALEPRSALPWWTRAARLASRVGRLAEAGIALYRALWITGDEPARRDALTSLGGIAEARNDVPLLQTVSQELLRLGTVLQDDLTLLHGLQRRSGWLLRSGRAHDAETAALEALGIARRLRDPELLAQSHGAYGGALMAGGQLEAAREALLLATQTTNPQLQLRIYANLGSVSGMLGRLEEALEHMELALTLSRSAQNLAVTGMILYNLGATAEKLGQLKRAETGFREATEIAERVGNGPLIAQGTLALAKLHAAQGRFGEAFNTAGEALELARETPLQPQVQYVLGELEAKFGRLEVAAALYAEAHKGFEVAGNARLVSSVEVSQALLSLQRGDGKADELVRHKLKALHEAGHMDQFDHARLEFALLSDDAAALRWALEGLPERAVVVQIARVRLHQIQGTDWDLQPLEAALGAAWREERYAELPLGYGLLAAFFEKQGDTPLAVQMRERARAAGLKSAAGLPKLQRAAYQIRFEADPISDSPT